MQSLFVDPTIPVLDELTSAGCTTFELIHADVLKTRASETCTVSIPGIKFIKAPEISSVGGAVGSHPK